MIKVEVCINSDNIKNVQNSVSAAYDGGASTIELCSQMQCEGLTPIKSHIIKARKAFQDRNGLMVMIRPRKGDFSYSNAELVQMQQQIQIAADLGADGVVFGILQKSTNNIAIDALQKLMQTCYLNNLKVTFHRAFDALLNPLESIESLIELGFHRILTSGVP